MPIIMIMQVWRLGMPEDMRGENGGARTAAAIYAAVAHEAENARDLARWRAEKAGETARILCEGLIGVGAAQSLAEAKAAAHAALAELESAVAREPRYPGPTSAA